ncbi:Protocadherin Fat 1 [Eumeta japonica]|uniref:Protocadherin Fat 1 n=1 Tax=Eumeta variegata TaxID=151549 RepID=A0A4C1YW71_EUMVA|nr:Protocadherin Fat 1 [Eumeta japonica]
MQVAIEIVDTNNKVPELGEFAAEVEIYENAPHGTAVLLLEASDLDRDEIYHRLNYAINYAQNPRLEAFFAVDPDSGLVFVHYTSAEVLDRDRGEDTHRIFFTITDNFLREGDGNRNPTEAQLLVRLLDENDNAPELPPRGELAWTVSESLQQTLANLLVLTKLSVYTRAQGERLQPDIYAPDIDEPDTDNSRVGYGIEALTLLDRDVPVPELFVMVDIDNKTGELETAMALRGYWGSYDIHIWVRAVGLAARSLRRASLEATRVARSSSTV